MSVRDENYNWKEESTECVNEIRKVIEPIVKKYNDKFSYEDLYYLVCTEVSTIITREILKKKLDGIKK